MDPDAYEVVAGEDRSGECDPMELPPIGRPLRSRRWLAAIEEQEAREMDAVTPNASATDEELRELVDDQLPYCWMCEATATGVASRDRNYLQLYVDSMAGRANPVEVWRIVAKYYVNVVRNHNSGREQTAAAFARHFTHCTTDLRQGAEESYRIARDAEASIANHAAGQAGEMTLDTVRALAQAQRSKREAAAALDRLRTGR